VEKIGLWLFYLLLFQEKSCDIREERVAFAEGEPDELAAGLLWNGPASEDERQAALPGDGTVRRRPEHQHQQVLWARISMSGPQLQRFQKFGAINTFGTAST